VGEKPTLPRDWRKRTAEREERIFQSRGRKGKEGTYSPFFRRKWGREFGGKCTEGETLSLLYLVSDKERRGSCLPSISKNPLHERNQRYEGKKKKGCLASFPCGTGEKGERTDSATCKGEERGVTMLIP